jgi:hypothetical protein
MGARANVALAERTADDLLELLGEVHVLQVVA